MSEPAVSLVTGAATGIGAAIIRRLARPGARLVVHTGANREGAERVAREAQDRGAETLVLLGDVGDADVPARLVAETLQRFGRIDHLVNNAGYALKRRYGIQLSPNSQETRKYFASVRTLAELLLMHREGRAIA